MTYRRYDHLERLGHDEVSGIELGRVHIFPKLDGTNGVVFLNLDGNRVCAGSRNRKLSEDVDNHGFRGWLDSDDPKAVTLRDYVRNANFPAVVYGEWLIPHTLKTYRPDAWRRFWIFDVFDKHSGHYLSWDQYGPELIRRGLDVVEPLCTIVNPSEDQLRAQVETNTYLIANGAGLGEGVVIKNYAWRNRFGRQPWAKVVRNEFREEHRRAMGTPEKGGEFQVELAIVEEFVTPALVGKTRAKIVAALANATGVDLAADPNAPMRVEESNRAKLIPQLLGRVFHDLVAEETWAALKKFDMPTIDFKKLSRATTARVKLLASDLF